MTFIKKCKIILDTILKRKKLCYDNSENRKEVSNVAKYNKKMESFARDILVKNDMLKLPVTLIKIADENNIEVYYNELPDGISGAIRYNQEKNVFQILIEKRDPEYRKRFTLAHELSHFFLQGKNLSDTKAIHYDVLYRGQRNDIEREADYLAGALLMEESILKRLFKINPSIKELSEIFNVSESAVTVRLMQLKLI